MVGISRGNFFGRSAACAAAWAEIGIVEESETLPASIASNRRYNFIILVSEAG